MYVLYLGDCLQEKELFIPFRVGHLSVHIKTVQFNGKIISPSQRMRVN